MKINIPSFEFNDLSDNEIMSKTFHANIHRFSHAGILTDLIRAEINKGRNRKICERCNGSGNQLYSMFQECENCGGKGYLI